MRLSKRVLAGIWLIASLTASTCAIAESLTRIMLIVDESDPGAPFAYRFRDQVHWTLAANTTQRYAILAESFDFGHFRVSDYDAILLTYFKNKYRNTPINVIIALGSESLKFLSRTRAEIWSEVPIVFVTLDDAVSARAIIPANGTGTISPRRVRDLVKSARLLVPHLAQIALVGDSFEYQAFRRHYQQELQQFTKELNLIDLTALPLNEVMTRVADLPDSAAIIYMPIYIDKSGISHNPIEALKAVAEVANRPIVVDSETFVGIGGTGGFVVSAEDLGREAGQLTARILAGERVESIPIAVKDLSKPVFDARQLARWGISETALPAGSDLRFREPNAWERYRWQILAIAAVVVIQGLMIAWLFYERRQRRTAEGESHQHLLEVTQMDRAMTTSAMSASIAHELNQPLGAILSNAEAAEILLCANSPDHAQLKEILADIRRDDQRAADIIKHLRILLKQGELGASDIDLTEIVNNTLDILEPQAAAQGVILQVEPGAANLRVRADPVHIQQVLLNLAMNAIDAMQHLPEGERILRLQVSRGDTDVVVSIADTGTGIPEDKLNGIFKPFVTTKQHGTGLGLSIARTIVGTYGGRIWAENNAGGGAIFRFTLSLVQAKAA